MDLVDFFSNIEGGENAAGAMYDPVTSTDYSNFFTNPEGGENAINAMYSDPQALQQLAQTTGVSTSQISQILNAAKGGLSALQQFTKDNPWAAPIAGAVLGAIGGTQQPKPAVTTNAPWEPTQNYLTTSMDQASQYGSSPLPYANAGEMVAPLTEMQQSGAGVTRNILTNRTLPFLKAAYAGATPMVSGDYMDVNKNPYLAAAIDAANRPVTQAFNEQVLPGIRGQYAGDDYNNSRQGIAEGVATRGYLQTLADNAAKMANQGYTSGLNATVQAQGQAPNLVSAGSIPGQQMYNIGALLQGQTQQEINAKQAYDALRLARIQNPFNIYSTAAGRGSTQTVAPPTANPFTSAIGGALVGSQIQNFANPQPRPTVPAP